MTAPHMAAKENHATPVCPDARTTNEARSGLMAEPVFPPNWNRDCASPSLPPEDSLATRDPSGWKIAEPMPSIEDPISSTGKVGDAANSRTPAKVMRIPLGRKSSIGL